MSAEDRARWDLRYRAGARPQQPGPPVLLERAAPWLADRGSAVDIACGLGAATHWLADRGFSVDAVDISSVALEALKEAVVGEPYRPGRVRAVEADLDEGWPEALSGPYDVVLCLHFRYPYLGDVVSERLRPGGLVIASVLSVVGRDLDKAGGPDARFLAEPGELVAQLAGMDVLVHEEGSGLEGIIARGPAAGA